VHSQLNDIHSLNWRTQKKYDGRVYIMKQFKDIPPATNDSGDKFSGELGQRLYTIRTIKKMSRDALGEIMGVTGQQIRKYETGQNRMMPERIMMCAEIFNVPIGYFYGEGERAVTYDKASLTIASAINDIQDKDVKQAMYYLALAINKAG
jgi:transcriptional regulator with XRE-family HTH domain